MSRSPIFFLLLPLSPVISILTLHWPVLISLQPVIILLYQSCQFPFFVFHSFFYFSRLFKFSPSANRHTVSLHFLCQGLLLRDEEKKTKDEGLAKIKGLGPLPQVEQLPTAIYLLFATRSVCLMERGSRERETQTTHFPDNNDIPNSPKGGTFRCTYGFVLLG